MSSMEVSVIHRFEFPEYCNVLEITPDAKTLIGAGAYKPCMGIFDLEEHTQKLERNTDEEIIRISVLGEDWKKLALLHRNGKIEFHSRFGKHCVVDLPKECRDMKSDLFKGEVLAAGKSAEVFRFSTVEGKFNTPLMSKHAGIESLSVNKASGIYSLCTSTGACEFVDSRDLSPITSFSLSSGATASEFSDDGIYFGVGTEEGLVHFYDLRSKTPLVTKDHMYDFPIRKLTISKSTVTSLDQKGAKVWSRSTGKTLASVEPPFRANTFVEHEGILFIGGDAQSAKTYYVPELGKIPKWCSYLEGTTEEMAEIKKQTYFDSYKFVTEDRLKALGLTSELGKTVKPHLHGYLVPADLYEKKHAVIPPYNPSPKE
ncbi:ribosome biogenesis protein ENP2 [Nematocida sp. AWRm77]|nr:ribosome biogenesis protein ENP2 [Nematocida sp. AWRm77]